MRAEATVEPPTVAVPLTGSSSMLVGCACLRVPPTNVPTSASRAAARAVTLESVPRPSAKARRLRVIVTHLCHEGGGGSAEATVRIEQQVEALHRVALFEEATHALDQLGPPTLSSSFSTTHAPSGKRARAE